MVEAAPAGALPAVFDERNLSFADATVNALQALGRAAEAACADRRHHPHPRQPPAAISAASGWRRPTTDARRSVASWWRAISARRWKRGLANCTRLTRYRPARFVGIGDGSGGVRSVRIADATGEHDLRAKLLVAADGTRSSVRDALGIAADTHDYLQTLFVARLRAERAPDGTAYERLGDDGPTALLPRGDRHFGVVHGVARDDADAGAGARRCRVPRAHPAGVRLARRAPALGRRTQRLSGDPRGRAADDGGARGAGRQCGADAASDRRAGLQPRPARCADARRTDRDPRRRSRRSPACWKPTSRVAWKIARARWR